MNKILTIFLFIPFILSIASIGEEDFLNNCNKCYNEYTIILDNETTVGDITIVFGLKNNEYYLSCFLLNTNSTNYWISIYLDDNISSFVPDGGVVCGYGLKIGKAQNVKILLRNDNDEINILEITKDELISKLSIDKITGSGIEKFPKNKKEVNLLTKLRVAIIVFLAISLLIAFALAFLYKKAVGRFNKNYKENPIGFPGEEEIIDDKVDDVIETSDYSVEQDNKQELMDRYFEEYRHGDITEEELNEKLKKLWWKNND